MYLVVGLGNPDEEYDNTRHNMGFNAINGISKKYNIKLKKNKFQGLFEIGEIEGQKVILVKPQTYNIVELCPHVDKILTFNRYSGRFSFFINMSRLPKANKEAIKAAISISSFLWYL